MIGRKTVSKAFDSIPKCTNTEDLFAKLRWIYKINNVDWKGNSIKDLRKGIWEYLETARTLEDLINSAEKRIKEIEDGSTLSD